MGTSSIGRTRTGAASCLGFAAVLASSLPGAAAGATSPDSRRPTPRVMTTASTAAMMVFTAVAVTNSHGLIPMAPLVCTGTRARDSSVCRSSRKARELSARAGSGGGSGSGSTEDRKGGSG